MKKMPHRQQKSQLIWVAPREDPLSPIQLTEVQLDKLREAAKKCKVTFRWHRPLVINSEPITIEGLKMIRSWEEDGMVVTEYEIPEGADLRDLLKPFGHIDPEQDFFKDYEE